MKGYVSLARNSWRSLRVYRMNFLLILLGTVVQAVAMLAVWQALLSEASPSRLAGFTWHEMKGYLLVAFAANALVSGYTDLLLAGRVLSGMVALDLTKPVDFQLARWAETLGFLGVELLAVGSIGVMMISVVAPVPLPTGWQGLLFVASLCAVVPLKFGIVYLTGVACFWTQNYQGVSWARAGIAGVLSGSLVPVELYPAWLQSLCQMSPFPSMVSTPALIFVGRVRDGEAALLFCWQVVWIAALWLIGRVAWSRGLRQITVHGG
jgi:ABC-2 type transport system permease protein